MYHGRREVEPSFDLRRETRAAPDDRRQELDRGLDEPLVPPVLLRQEGAHGRRDLGRALGRRQVEEPPASKLGAIREIRVLRERVVLPAAGVLDARPPPQPRRAVEVEPPAAPRPRTLLDHEVAVEVDRLDLRQRRVVPVEVRPAELDHAEGGVGEVMDHPEQEARRRHEVGIEHRDDLARGVAQPVGERAGLEAAAVGPVEILHVVAFGGETWRSLNMGSCTVTRGRSPNRPGGGAAACRVRRYIPTIQHRWRP